MNHAHDHVASDRRLLFALFLTLGYAFVELGAGFFSGSLALLSDAGHMFTDSLSLVLAVAADYLARRAHQRHECSSECAFESPLERRAAAANIVFMLLIAAGIVWAALQRLHNPVPIVGGIVTSIAAIGLLVNITVAKILASGHATFNSRAALLHVLGDLLGSVAAIAAGLVIVTTGWTPIDPILAIVVALLIGGGAINLLRELRHPHLHRH